MRALVHVEGFERQELHLRRGQAVIWAANLVHGGTPVKDSARTRHSQVTHDYFDGGAWYMPLGSDPFGGQVCFREVIDIRTGRMVPPHLAGQVLDLDAQPTVWRYPRPLPDWVVVDR